MWKFSATNLGKVSSADISVAPLLLLVGKNNTGKSYVATTLWGLTSLQSISSALADNDEVYSFGWNDLKSALAPEGFSVEITRDRAAEVFKRFSERLTRKAPEFLSDLFAFKDFKDAGLSISLSSSFEPFTISVLRSSVESEKRPPFFQLRVSRAPNLVTTYRMASWGPEEITKQIQRRVIAEIIRHAQVGPAAPGGGVLYIPAARTGLMLSFSAIVAQLFEQDEPGLPFPRPVTDFLQRLAFGFNSRPRPTNQVANWIEHRILQGNVEIEQSDRYKVHYVPDNTKISMPLHVTSSMVTELVPILLAVRAMPAISHIILEEPEAHLHLSAQRDMARALARLLNSGIRVTVTTHSDTFVQQINNLMQIHQHPNRQSLMEELGYEEADLIDPNEARAYEFISNPEGSIVQEADRTPDGFVVTSLNDTLFALAKETIRVGEDAK